MIQPSLVRKRSEGAAVWPRLRVATRSTWMTCCSASAGLLNATAVRRSAPSTFWPRPVFWRAMTLDPGCPEGREIVKKLVATADVVVANLPPEVLRSLALDLDSLRLVKPDIILTTVTAFGAGGPWSHKHGFDGVAQLMCGSTYLSGTPEQPIRAAVAWVDCGTASLAA
ncbi:MAG: hypothetical protein DMD83_27080, partial [Candidatus Rokuibacteriota bacterium]